MTREPAGDAPLGESIAAIEDAAAGGTLAVGDLLDTLEDRSLGFVLTVLGLAVAIPVVGAIPGMPATAGLAVLASIAHSALGGPRRFAAPEWLRARRVRADRVRAGLARVKPLAARLDAILINRRLAPLVATVPARAAIAGTAAATAAMMMVLALVPGLALPPALALAFFGLALIGRDGLFALVGYALAVVSAGLLLSAGLAVL